MTSILFFGKDPPATLYVVGYAVNGHPFGPVVALDSEGEWYVPAFTSEGAISAAHDFVDWHIVAVREHPDFADSVVTPLILELPAHAAASDALECGCDYILVDYDPKAESNRIYRLKEIPFGRG